MYIKGTVEVNSAKLEKYLRDKWGGRPCPLCHVAKWNIQSSVFELRQYNATGIVAGGKVIPIIPVTCTSCGNTVLVNAKVAMAMPEPEGK